jgi:hypothetical protein
VFSQNQNTVNTIRQRSISWLQASHYHVVIVVGAAIFVAAGLTITAVTLTKNSHKTPSPTTKSPTSEATSPPDTSTPDTPTSDTPKKAPAAPPTKNTDKNTATGTTPSSGSTSGGTSTGGGSTSTGSSCLAGTHVAGGSDAANGCWPGPNNTGVPAGTVLSAYTGPCTITTAGTIIDAKTVNCDMSIQAANVTIKNSKVNGLVTLDTDLGGSSTWSMTVQDTEIDAGVQQRAAISTGNMTVIRANLHGGITSAQCEETSVFCSITDSWLHGQEIPDTAPWHLGGFLSDGGSGMVLTHNTVVCDHAVNSVGEGCTGDLNFIPNFAAISGATVDHNLLGANIGSSYCTYGGEKLSSPTPHSDHIVYKNNVFQRGSNNICAAYGPVTNFDINQPGNQWLNNTWADGGIVDPAN